MFGPGSFSIWHWLIVLAVVVLLFGGGGKISKIMGDFGSGLKAFKKGVKEEETAEGEAKRKLETDRLASESTEKETVKG
ncbi:MAG: twin-arginine translocase TatA/TatE family subunit [Alphaproteobacteria bacterium]|nr:twin-arginine translocase TatA/TatE family subunit [Alphaproteobacteria bacterium]